MWKRKSQRSQPVAAINLREALMPCSQPVAAINLREALMPRSQPVAAINLREALMPGSASPMPREGMLST